MKKTILFIGLFILTLSTLLTSCDEDRPIGEIQSDNVITMGDVISPITSISSKSDNNDTYIIVNTETMNVVLKFKDKKEIPTGTFKLSLDGDNEAVVNMIYSGIEYDLIGNISISLSKNIYTINLYGNAFNSLYPYIQFTLDYHGMIGDSINNVFIINNSTHKINSCKSQTEYDYDGFVYDNVETDIIFYDEHSKYVMFSFDNYFEIPIGTFETNTTDIYFEGEVHTDKYYELTGTLTISLDNDIYNISFIGEAVNEASQSISPFTLNYKGKISSN